MVPSFSPRFVVSLKCQLLVRVTVLLRYDHFCPPPSDGQSISLNPPRFPPDTFSSVSLSLSLNPSRTTGKSVKKKHVSTMDGDLEVFWWRKGKRREHRQMQCVFPESTLFLLCGGIRGGLYFPLCPSGLSAAVAPGRCQSCQIFRHNSGQWQEGTGTFKSGQKMGRCGWRGVRGQGSERERERGKRRRKKDITGVEWGSPLSLYSLGTCPSLFLSLSCPPPSTQMQMSEANRDSLRSMEGVCVSKRGRAANTVLVNLAGQRLGSRYVQY